MSGELPRLAPVAVARAEAAWLQGRRDAVAAVTEEAYVLALEPAPRPPWVLGELAVWRRRAGLRDEAPSESRSRMR